MLGNFPFACPHDKSAGLDFEMLGGLGRVKLFDGFHAPPFTATTHGLQETWAERSFPLSPDWCVSVKLPTACFINRLGLIFNTYA